MFPSQTEMSDVVEAAFTNLAFEHQCSHWYLNGNKSPGNAGDTSLIPGSGRSPGGGHGNPLQYSWPGASHGERSPAGYSPWGQKESDRMEHTHPF